MEEKAMNEQTMKAERKRGQRYDESFRRQAVELWLRSGKKAEVVAGELGIRKWNLYEWRGQCKPLPVGGEGSGGAPRTLEVVEAENLVLRRELDRIKEQRDILKKALGITSESPLSAINGWKR